MIFRVQADSRRAQPISEAAQRPIFPRRLGLRPQRLEKASKILPIPPKSLIKPPRIRSP